MDIILKRRTFLVDVSAHDEVQNRNVVVSIFKYKIELFKHCELIGMGRQGRRIGAGRNN